MLPIEVRTAGGVLVRLVAGRAPASALFEALLGEPVVVRHLCPACGSDRHGRAWLQLPSGRRVDGSVAHAGPVTLVGVVDAEGVRLGVDLEPAGAAAPPGLRHAGDAAGLADLELWVAKEAYLKATGEGLRRDPASVVVGGGSAQWGAVDVPGCVAAWCLVQDAARPTGRLGQGGRAVSSSQADSREP